MQTSTSSTTSSVIIRNRLDNISVDGNYLSKTLSTVSSNLLSISLVSSSQSSSLLTVSNSDNGNGNFMSSDEDFDIPEWCNILSANCECHIAYQFYEYDEVILLGLVTLPIVIFGLLANLTSVRIFTHRLMFSSSINWYLAVLSCSDTLILFSAFFVLSLPRIGEYSKLWSATSLRYGKN
ncbi:unnamed protein product [Dracunculus medinensis]|uniref:G_PROTEIN_RECEP_F1_2 domain-containing protein n=1 Tax=Dracunculus medinensis TaxID=318479 RepID=A0A0N4U3R6_DRAME|nr:unnamed protein product [Dracunculus medinensis]